MLAILACLLAALLLAPGHAGAVQKADALTRLIGKGTQYESPYYVFETGKPGPVVLLEAGSTATRSRASMPWTPFWSASTCARANSWFFRG